ncbi:hypothetical protein [Propioniciclava soli]|uniref:Uncharacterized protein n=1 Tax=Propioniciclava soli TaxID=2775081 RepID=A0ABZ3C776_9ACTN|nr:hypothetical protein [Propioniciclava soli]
MTRRVGVDQGVSDALDAEPALRAACGRLAERGLAPVWVVTHVVTDGDGAHIAYTLDLPDVASSDAAPSDADLAALVAAAFAPDASGPAHAHDHALPGPAAVVVGGASAGASAGFHGAALALEARASGTAGRAVVYPGVDALRGVVPVAQVTDASAIDAVSSLGGAFTPETPLQTRNHVRPYLQGGRWVLAVQPAIGGTLVPFEDPAPKRCCQDK